MPAMPQQVPRAQRLNAKATGTAVAISNLRSPPPSLRARARSLAETAEGAPEVRRPPWPSLA